MDRLRKTVLLTHLIEGLCERGNWCGETHVQKTAFFVQELMGVPLEFRFILYKHGPFSFDLRNELTALRANGMLGFEPRSYGAQLVLNKDQCEYIQSFYPYTLKRYEKNIDFVTEKLGGKRVVELERLATAFYVGKRSGEGESVNSRARKVTELKPHITIEKAREAVREVDHVVSASEKVKAI